MGHRLDGCTAEIARLREQYDRETSELEKKYQEEMLELLRWGCIDLFNEYPVLTSFGWQQSWEWNDQEYEFRMPNCEEHLRINGEWYDEFDKTLPPTLRDAAMYIIHFLNSFREEDFQKMIGMGVEITITKTGISVREV